MSLGSAISTSPLSYCFLCILCIAGVNLHAQQPVQPSIEEVIVQADHLGQSQQQFAGSLSLIDAHHIEKQGNHLEDLFSLVPNINFSGGASRGRYIQIRGIGERSEFSEPVNHSVGVIIDGIDFTGISTAASNLDMQQVEVLRGPQGTLFGSNALAGLINMTSKEATITSDRSVNGYINTELGNFGSQQIATAIGATLFNQIGLRITAQKNQSNGFITNQYLKKNDTNNIDEQFVRAKLALQPTVGLDLNLTLFYADVDNGYDVFNFDNSRNTISDNPGHDRQKNNAYSLKTQWQLLANTKIESNLSANYSDMEYGYDEDWSNPNFCIENNCVDFDYSSKDNYLRSNDNRNIDLRVVHNKNQAAFVLGLYHKNQNYRLTRIYTFLDSPFESEFTTENTALYYEIKSPINHRLSLVTGARIENRKTNYRDNSNGTFATGETLWGGKASLNYDMEQGQLYALISRGYKAGGANANGTLPSDKRFFGTETLVNFELGLKIQTLNDQLQTQLSIFKQNRKNIQTDSAIVTVNPEGGFTFDDFITNAASGSNLGIEAELQFEINQQGQLYSNFGLLRAEFDQNFINYQHVLASTETGEGVDMTGREQAHAPSYQFTLGVVYDLSHALSVDINIEGKDQFLFSNDHDQKSPSYQTVNAQLAYSAERYQLRFFAKNITDQNIQIRGFGTFPNNPANGYSDNGPYVQYAAPRTFGVSATVNF